MYSPFTRDYWVSLTAALILVAALSLGLGYSMRMAKGWMTTTTAASTNNSARITKLENHPAPTPVVIVQKSVTERTIVKHVEAPRLHKPDDGLLTRLKNLLL